MQIMFHLSQTDCQTHMMRHSGQITVLKPLHADCYMLQHCGVYILKFFPNFPRHTGGTQRNWSLFFVTCSKLQQAVIVHVLFSWRREFFMLFTLLLPLKDHSVLLLFACARLDGYCCQTKGRHGLQDQSSNDLTV